MPKFKVKWREFADYEAIVEAEDRSLAFTEATGIAKPEPILVDQIPLSIEEIDHIVIKKADYDAFAKGEVDLIDTKIDGIDGYVEPVDWDSGLKIGKRNVVVNYYPDLANYEIAVIK